MKKLIIIVIIIASCFSGYAQTDITGKANKYFTHLISGNIDSAYSYMAKSFTDKVSKPMLENAHQTFLKKFGTFVEISGVLQLNQQNQEYAIVSTTFSLAKPLFTVYFDQEGKVVGLFNTAENLKSMHIEPTYADKSLYEEKDFIVQTGTFKLPGTLTVPKNKTKYPVIVFVHGSGQQDRDETIENVKPFRDLALGLAAKGIATIRYDKRTKVYGINSVPKDARLTIKEETIDDAVSALQMAAKLPNVNPSKVYLLGHSLGAMFAPRIAASVPQLAGIIEMAMPARPFGEMMEEQFKYLVSLQPQDDKVNEAFNAVMVQVNEIKHADTIADQKKLVMGAPAYYWADLNTYNAVTAAKNVKIPMLFLQGARDYNVTVADLNIFKENLKGKKNASFIVYPELNHAFTPSPGTMSTPSEYKVPANVPIKVIEDIADFILKK